MPTFTIEDGMVPIGSDPGDNPGGLVLSWPTKQFALASALFGLLVVPIAVALGELMHRTLDVHTLRIAIAIVLLAGGAWGVALLFHVMRNTPAPHRTGNENYVTSYVALSEIKTVKS
jgi:hypothetical protein